MLKFLETSLSQRHRFEHADHRTLATELGIRNTVEVENFGIIEGLPAFRQIILVVQRTLMSQNAVKVVTTSDRRESSETAK